MSLVRGNYKGRTELDMAPCSQYVAALTNGKYSHSNYGLRSRGPIDDDDSYKCAENYEGHALIDNKLREWKLNKGMGIRPIICINADDVHDLV